MYQSKLVWPLERFKVKYLLLRLHDPPTGLPSLSISSIFHHVDLNLGYSEKYTKIIYKNKNLVTETSVLWTQYRREWN